MRAKLIIAIASIVAAASISQSAEANVFNGWGRYLGLGWSDGYHAHNDCRPCHHHWRFTPGFSPPPRPGLSGPPAPFYGGPVYGFPAYGASHYNPGVPARPRHGHSAAPAPFYGPSPVQR